MEITPKILELLTKFSGEYWLTKSVDDPKKYRDDGAAVRMAARKQTGIYCEPTYWEERINNG